MRYRSSFVSAPLIWVWIAVTMATAVAVAQPAEREVAAEWLPPASQVAAEPPSFLAERAGLEPQVRLAAAADGAAEQLDALRRWNREGGTPTRNGFVRTLPAPLAAVGSTEASAGVAVEVGQQGETRWATRIHVPGAYGLRLHLTHLRLPPGARWWVYGSDRSALGPFGAELRGPSNDLWAPTVGGDTAFIELLVPAGTAGRTTGPFFRIAELLEIFDVAQPAV